MWAAMGSTSGHGYPGSGVYTTGYLKAFAGSTGSSSIGDYAVYRLNSGPGDTNAEPRTTRPVGSKVPNELGLYDMSGNVWEWTWDWWASYPSGGLSDPTGLISGTNRVLRGGGWSSLASLCTVAYRNSYNPHLWGEVGGFRVVFR